MSYRNFSDEADVLAKRWANMALTPDPWHLGEKVADATGRGDTESSPHMAYNGPLRCVAKENGGAKARSAIEKIVSDLAYHLEFPVPPIVLWDRQQVDGERHFCLVAWAFEPAMTWDEAQQHLSEEERNELIATFSAAQAFETWISAHDRGGKHILVNVEPTLPAPRIAFIDYAYSLSHKWDGPNHPDPGAPFVPASADKTIVAQAAESIEKLDESQINRIVSRVPESFLPMEKRDIILENLLSRRSSLRDLLRLS